MTGWDAVGGNPCPGDVGALRSRAAALKAVSDHGENLHRRLNDLHAGMGGLRWSGEGATAIAAIIEKNVPDLQKLWTSHLDAANALGTYVNHLEDLQRHAGAALRDYAQAVADQAAAQADHDHAAGRHSSARWQVRELTAELKTAQAQRLVAAAAHQPTGALDARIISLEDDIRHQSGLATAAARDMDVAHARSSSADDRIRNARARIETARQENEDYVRVAAKVVLGAVGIVHSNNPAVRAWADVTHGAQTGAKWFDEYGLNTLDDAVTALALISLVTPLAPVVGGIVFGLSLLSLAGHIYRRANNEESDLELAKHVIGVIPFGHFVGKLSKAKNLSAEVASARVDNNLPGLLKRSVWPENASHATGLFSSRGGPSVLGRTLYTVKATPKQTSGPQWLWETLMSGEIAKQTLDVKERLMFFVHGAEAGAHLLGDHSAVRGAPVNTVQLQTAAAS